MNILYWHAERFTPVIVASILIFDFFFLVQEKYLSADKTLQNAKPADVVYER